MNQPMPFEDLEKVYDRIAEAIDSAGPARESLFLCKLCVTLAHRLGDRETVETAIESALANLDV